MVFIDSNIFMYAAGTSHENKIPSVRFLHRIAAKEIEGCINSEILQEILHRYRLINRWDDGKEVYQLTKKITPIIIPVDTVILDLAFDLLEQYSSIFARDSVHAATCIHYNIEKITSYDTDFDLIDTISRIQPEEV